MNKYKILYVLDCLKTGGAQRASLNIVNNLERDRFNVTLVLLNKSGALKKYLDPNIRVIDLNINSAKFGLFKLARTFAKEKPDLVISTPTYMSELSYLASKLLRKKPIMVIRSAVMESVNLPAESLITRILYKKSFSNADKIITLTEMMKEDIIDTCGVERDDLKVLPNMVDRKYIEEKAHEEIKEEKLFEDDSIPKIISMGRLTEQKGFKYLIKAFKKLLDNNNGKGKLIIIGKGILGNNLVNYVQKLGIKKKVRFLGFKENPYKYIKKADLFVLSSLWEGFPNAILEAMVCEVPVVSYDCSSGPSDIITSGLDGILVPPKDTDELYRAMEDILNRPDFMENIVQNTKQRAKDFSIENVIGQYEEYLSNVIERRRETVFHLITSLNIGETENFLKDVVLKTQDNFNHVVGYIKELGAVGKELKKKGVKVVPLPSFFKIMSFIKKLQPAFIHTHLYRANILGRLAGMWLNIPVISSQQSIDAWKKWYHVQLDAITGSSCKKIIANSEYTAKLIEQREGISSFKTEVVYMGIPDDFAGEELSEEREITQKIGFVGRLHEEKGADLLIELARILKAKQEPFELKIAGDGPLKEKLEKELPDNANLLGWKEGDKLKEFYRSVDLLVLTSREESLPRVLIESAAFGRPTVAPNIAGIPEFITGGETGFLYEKGNIPEAFTKIQKFYELDDSERKEISKNLKESLKDFSISEKINRISGIYEDIISENQ